MTSEERSAAARKGGLARAKQFTPEYQRATRAAAPYEVNAARGRKTWLRLVERHGVEGAMQRLVKRRLANPSSLERVIIAFLDEREITYQREAYIAGQWVDFLIGDLVVQVDSGRWHTIHFMTGADQAGRDVIQDMCLTAQGYRILRITDVQIKSGAYRAILDKEI
jgi:very-short-patch-repair endonuclease